MENKVVKRDTRFKKGQGGRKPGSQNIITRTVKETVLATFNELQTEDCKWNLKKFAMKYPRDFYAIAAKLIPTEIHARINKVELHVIRTGKDLPENFAPAATEDSGHSETVQHG